MCDLDDIFRSVSEREFWSLRMGDRLLYRGGRGDHESVAVIQILEDNTREPVRDLPGQTFMVTGKVIRVIRAGPKATLTTHRHTLAGRTELYKL
jgi:hypothetical protein